MNVENLSIFFLSHVTEKHVDSWHTLLKRSACACSCMTLLRLLLLQVLGLRERSLALERFAVGDKRIYHCLQQIARNKWTRLAEAQLVTIRLNRRLKLDEFVGRIPTIVNFSLDPWHPCSSSLQSPHSLNSVMCHRPADLCYPRPRHLSTEGTKVSSTNDRHM